MMIYFLAVLYAAIIFAFGVGVSYLFAKADEEITLLFTPKYLILAALYSLASGWATASLSGAFNQIQILILFSFLCAQAYMDLQTSVVYLIQTLALFILQVSMFLYRIATTDVGQILLKEANPVVNDCFHMLTLGPYQILIAIGIFMFIIIALGVLKSIAKNDVLIFACIALAFCSLGEMADVRFGLSIISAYTCFIVFYLGKIIYRKIKYKESILSQRCPFTAPIALGTTIALLVFI